MRHSRLVPRLVLATAIAALVPVAAGAQARRDVPYTTSFGLTLTSGSGTMGHSPDPIPANKRLVVEYVSVSVQAQPGEKPALYLQDTVNGAGRAYWVPLTLVDSSGGWELYRASQMVKLYVDGNGASGPGIQCNRAVNSFSTMVCGITLSGYLTDR